jgi:hypothetical protein
MDATYKAYDRSHLNRVLVCVRRRFPGINVADAGVTYTKIGSRKHYSFQFGSFFWDGRAETAWDARAKGWTAYLERADQTAMHDLAENIQKGRVDMAVLRARLGI